MCRVCNLAKRAAPAEALKMIETSIKNGAKPEHFKTVLDDVLGTAEPEVNEEADDAFERAYRDR
jgi:hypothetical protein